jgi:hypothetical protein
MDVKQVCPVRGGLGEDGGVEEAFCCLRDSTYNIG